MFKQLASGQFTVEVEGLYHCGPNHESPKTFAYEAEVHYPIESLDERGFLLDNLTFSSWFDALGSITESCEMLARRACCELWGVAEGRCGYMRVAIWGIKGEKNAMVEFTLDCDPKDIGLGGTGKPLALGGNG